MCGICAVGPRPSRLGAGLGQMSEYYGMPPLCWYLADNTATALSYPHMHSSHQGPGGNRVTGASLLAIDGSYPIRMLYRVEQRGKDAFWQRGKTKQKAFPIDSGYLACIQFVAVPPWQMHEDLKYLRVFEVRLEDGSPC